MFKGLCTCTFVCMCKYINMCVCVCVCLCCFIMIVQSKQLNNLMKIIPQKEKAVNVMEGLEG